ncbi:uncharacterized protein LOC115428589 [Sphaeramia orbicularis]|uniref:uncharacterized protein LOC115428589 n=1 Tax=Sphaeramia orbicularis TaxID=375764 RepID=UPI00117BF54E|nr:uncharacterized protein LOC115428589 [Sphaeramia orbicularis]
MDPAPNTLEDLMLRIHSFENIGSSREVCLYTVDGMPLTDDPFFNTWSLQDRHIKDGDIIYAIFTPKANLITSVTSTNTMGTMDTDFGTSKIRCHIMLKGDFEVNVDLEKDTISNLKNKLANESGIPAHVLHYIGGAGTGITLENYGITEEKTVYFSLSTFDEEAPSSNAFFSTDIVPSVQQTPKGMSVFLSSLYVIKHKSPVVSHNSLIGYIRKLTGCNPLAQSLHQLLLRNEAVSRIQRIAVVEGLYTLFREILPNLGSKHGDKIIEDGDVFEYSPHCWAYLMSEAKKETSHHENYAPVSLTTEQGRRFCEPVTVAGVPGALERADVLKKIKDGEKIPNCTEAVLQPTSLRRDTEIEKILLSVHPSIRTYHLWISHGSVTGQNFHLNIEKSFGMMEEEMKAFPLLCVTPPLLLKDLGYQESCLVFLCEGGCCFKPETSKDGLKLFETETVLSLEISKPKNKADPSSVTEQSLAGSFATHGYDDIPEAVLPSQINSKVTVTQNISAEEYLTTCQKYDQEAKKHTVQSAGQSLDDMEKKLVEPVSQDIPEYLKCPLSKKMFVDPVKTKHGAIYEQKAIEKHLKISRFDPFNKTIILRRADLKLDPDMKSLVTKFRLNQIPEISV